MGPFNRVWIHHRTAKFGPMKLFCGRMGVSELAGLQRRQAAILPETCTLTKQHEPLHTKSKV